ncbi:MAG: LysR family transcriptional regulator, partial [Nocardioidaceae bacterium]
MNLDPDRLRLLVEVARHGSMTGAAHALSYTPSAISQQIRRLEAEVRLPVVERHARGVELTDAGRTIVEHAEAIERQLDALATRLDDIAGLRTGSLRLGTFPTVASSLLPLVVTRFRERHPGVRLIVQSGRKAQLLDLLERRQVETTLLWDYTWSRVDRADIELVPVMDDPTALVVARGHPLASRRSVRMADLADETWIIRGDQHPVAEVLSRTARAAGFEPTVSFEANDYQEAQAMVAVGLGIAIAPRLALANLRDDVTVVSLGPEAPRRRILLASLAGRRPSPPETAMREVFQ